MTIGILGGGQLGRMLALAAYPLGMNCRLLDPAPDAPAGRVAECFPGAYDDLAALDRYFRDAEVVTFESENVPIAAVRSLARSVAVHPRPEALEATQDRLAEKNLCQRLGIPTAAFTAVDSAEQLNSAIRRIGAPCVLKTRRLGYDGKGQFVLRGAEDAEAAWRRLGGTPLILEEFIDWDREMSLIAARDHDGAIHFYPLVENRHVAGVLRLTVAPAPGLTADLQKQAEMHTTRVLEALQYVGVITLEFFQCGSTLLVNEMAPRVHNSGHWTIEGAETSQFENHLRAVVGLPLGSTAPRGHSAMVNLIGRLPPRADVLAVPGAALHLYGKAPRPGRKLGHVTLCHADPGVLQTRLDALYSRLAEPVPGGAGQE